MSMKLKLFTLRFNSSLGEFDETDVMRFLADKELIEVREHFFAQQGLPYLALILLYNSVVNLGSDNNPNREAGKQSDRFDPREILSEEDWPLYLSLKEWRNELAKQEGIPPYIIATNRQMAEIAKDRPDSLEGLKRIEGLGKAKVESYGSAILGFTQKAGNSRKDGKTESAENNVATQQS